MGPYLVLPTDYKNLNIVNANFYFNIQECLFLCILQKNRKNRGFMHAVYRLISLSYIASSLIIDAARPCYSRKVIVSEVSMEMISF